MINYTTKSEKYNHSQNPSLKNQKNLKVFSTKTDSILTLLLTGKRITPKDAVYDLNIFCLAQIVFLLRHLKNIPVKTKMIKNIDSFGQISSYAEYFLSADDIAEIKAKDYLQ